MTSVLHAVTDGLQTATRAAVLQLLPVQLQLPGCRCGVDNSRHQQLITAASPTCKVLHHVPEQDRILAETQFQLLKPIKYGEPSTVSGMCFLLVSPVGLIQPELQADGLVCVDMGEPILEGPKVPTTLAPTQGRSVVQQQLTVDGRTYEMTCVSMGNPHAITYTVDGQPIKVGMAVNVDLPHVFCCVCAGVWFCDHLECCPGPQSARGQICGLTVFDCFLSLTECGFLFVQHALHCLDDCLAVPMHFDCQSPMQQR